MSGCVFTSARWSPFLSAPAPAPVACRSGYDTDLTPSQYALIEPLLPPLSWLLILNSILRTGAAWRLMPHDLATWQTAYHYQSLFSKDGTLERIHAVLREAVRREEGRHECPSAAIIDSQSVKTAEKGEL